jgi:hypothetical protein
MMKGMRKSIGSMLCVLAVGATVLMQGGKARAACGIPTEMGRSTISFNVAQTGDYKLWFRVKPQNTTNNALYALVDNVACYKIGDDVALPANTWSWVQHGKAGTTNTPLVHSFSVTGKHTLALIGNEPNVAVDKLLLVPAIDSCVPDDSKTNGHEPGDNCGAASLVETKTPAGTIVGTTTSGRTVQLIAQGSLASGDVVLDPSVVQKADSIVLVEYFVDTHLIVAASEPPFSLDTTLLADGDYQITQKVYYKDGTTKEDVFSLSVNNVDDLRQPSPENRSSTGEIVLGIGLVFLLAGGIFGVVLLLKPTLRKSLLSIIDRHVVRRSS